MELNMNYMKGHSLDDDDAFSNISRISCGLQNSLNSTCNSDSECSGPVSVRHMIQHYNNQLKQSESSQTNHKGTYKVNMAKRYHHPSQYLVPATKSSYCGLNNYGSYGNGKPFADQIEHDNRTASSCCMSCSACMCCRNRSRKNSATNKMLSSTASSFSLLPTNENNQKPNSNYNMHNIPSCCCIRSSSTSCNKINANDTRILAVENCSNNKNDAAAGGGAGVVADFNVDTATASGNNATMINDFCAELKDSSDSLFKNNNSQIVAEKKQSSLLSIDSNEESNICQQPPAETSYQSKTTIAKTSSGVRIIIDIFFDQERCVADAADMVGSRVETDIPQSRILNEFQKQTMGTNVDAPVNSYQGL